MSELSLVSTVELQGWLEGWQWHMAEDLDRGDESAADVDAVQIEAIEAELGRRKRLIGKPGAPRFETEHPWPRERFQRVKQQVRLEDYAQTYCLLQRAEWRGRNLWACCPLPEHRETTPSFKIDPQKQSWHCFGCHKHGDVIDLAMLIEGAWQVTAAVERLEGLFGLGPWSVSAKPEQEPQGGIRYTIERADGTVVPMRTPVGLRPIRRAYRS